MRRQARKEVAPNEADRNPVRRNFDRAAATYDRFADVQGEVARRLLDHLPAADSALAQIVELGCGTGKLTSRLRERYPSARITGIDFSPEMIKRAAARLQGDKVRFFCRDIREFLAGYAGSADLIVSNATLQWIDELEPVFASAREHLQKNGLLVFSIFGPDSLVELQEALDAVMPGAARLAARSFKSEDRIAKLLKHHFTRVDNETMRIGREYADVVTLLRQIRKTGTGGAHQQPLRFSRQYLEAMNTWFKKRYGVCRASYQVMFFRCRP